MSEKEERPKSKRLGSKIFYLIIAIVAFVLMIYYILKAIGSL